MERALVEEESKSPGSTLLGSIGHGVHALSRRVCDTFA
jgi:hypothetical protein